MSATLTTTDNPFAPSFERAAELARSGPGWLQSIRTSALAAHRQMGIPSMKDEEWKYTSLRPIMGLSLVAAEPGPAVFETELREAPEGAVRIVLVNGRFDRNLSQVPAIPGLRATSLYDALVERPDFLESYLGKISPTDGFTFSALNSALFEDGVLLHMSEGFEADSAIEILHISTGGGQVIAPRVLIVADRGSSANIFESYVSDGPGTTVTVPVTEVFVAEGANLEHVRFQDESLDRHHIGLWQVWQAGASEYRSYNVAFGARIGRLDQQIYLDGENVVTRLDGVVIAKGEQVLDNHTRLDHAYPNGNSFEIYKQIVDDEATVVFNGKIFVHEDAQKTDAKQTNQALLLSPKATIDSKPQLEIFADDVKCTHGATVGQLEDTPMFYLRQRGVPRHEAEAILVYAFAAEVLELIENDSVRHTLESKLYKKLSGG